MDEKRIPRLELRKVSKSYLSGGRPQMVLEDLDFTVRPGDFTAVLGKSGSGKTTLLHIMAGILAPDQGEVLVNGHPLGKNQKERSRYRREKIGLILQDYGLIDELTVLDNLRLAAKMTGSSQNPKDLLAGFGLFEKAGRYPGELSGGEKQRTAIARALVKNPEILLCDEPTGALDRRSGEEVMRELLKAKDQGNTVVLITHDQDWAKLAKDVYQLENGRLRKWEKS